MSDYHLPDYYPPDAKLPDGMPRPMVPVSVQLVNVIADELAQLVAIEIPFKPLHNVNGGVFVVETMFETLLYTDDDALFAIFEYARKHGADYVIASVNKEQA